MALLQDKFWRICATFVAPRSRHAALRNVMVLKFDSSLKGCTDSQTLPFHIHNSISGLKNLIANKRVRVKV